MKALIVSLVFCLVIIPAKAEQKIILETSVSSSSLVAQNATWVVFRVEDGIIAVINKKTGVRLRLFVAKPDAQVDRLYYIAYPNALILSGDILTMSFWEYQDGSDADGTNDVPVWDLSHPKEEVFTEGYRGGVKQYASPCNWIIPADSLPFGSGFGWRIAVNSEDRTMAVFNYHGFQVFRFGEEDPFQEIFWDEVIARPAWTADGKYIALGSKERGYFLFHSNPGGEYEPVMKLDDGPTKYAGSDYGMGTSISYYEQDKILFLINNPNGTEFWSTVSMVDLKNLKSSIISRVPFGGEMEVSGGFGLVSRNLFENGNTFLGLELYVVFIPTGDIIKTIQVDGVTWGGWKRPPATHDNDLYVDGLEVSVLMSTTVTVDGHGATTTVSELRDSLIPITLPKTRGGKLFLLTSPFVFAGGNATIAAVAGKRGKKDQVIDSFLPDGVHHLQTAIGKGGYFYTVTGIDAPFSPKASFKKAPEKIKKHEFVPGYGKVDLPIVGIGEGQKFNLFPGDYILKHPVFGKLRVHIKKSGGNSTTPANF